MKNLKVTVACILLALGIEEMVRWFIITDKNSSLEAMKEEYINVLPTFLQNTMLHTVILLGCFLLAGILFLQVKTEKPWKIIVKSAAILSFVLAFWQLFSLM